MKRILAIALLLSIALAMPLAAGADYVVGGMVLEKCHVFYDNGADAYFPINGPFVYLYGGPYMRIKSFVVLSRGQGDCYYSADKGDWTRLLPSAEFEKAIKVQFCHIPGDPVRLTIMLLNEPPKLAVPTPTPSPIPATESTETYG